MRYCYLIIYLIFALLVADAVMFDGRYRDEVWQEAKAAGTWANFHVAQHLRSAGLVR
jgi:hypothetical protein